jgi:type I restriction enzyme S subunit
MNILFDNLESLIDVPNGIEKTRELILQLAIQGKLTSQNTNDEPTSELLRKIFTAKKIYLDDKGMRKDEFNYEAPNDNTQFIIPSHWMWVNFGEIVVIIRGITFPSSAKYKDPIEGLCVCLRTANVQKKVDWNNLIYIPIEYVKNNYQWVEKNDILISMANSLELVGKVSLVENVPAKSTFGGFISVIRSFVIDPAFLWLALRSHFFQESMRDTASQTTNIANISLGGIKPLPFPLPPLNEQKRIVEKVNSLMALLDELEEKRERRNLKRIKLNNASLEKLLTSKDDKELKTNWKRIEENFSTLYSVPENVEKLKQAILQLAVQGKLVKQDTKDEPASELLMKIKKEKEKLIAEKKIQKQEDLDKITENEMLFSIPKNWEWTNIQNIAFVTKLAGFEYTKYVELKDSGEVPVIRAQNVRTGRLDERHLLYLDMKTSLLLHRCALTKPAILMTFIGAGIGDVAIFNKNERWHLAPNVAKIEPFKNDNDFIDLTYFLFYLMSPAGRTEIFSFQKSTAQPSLSMGTIRQVKFALPPLKEQKRIVEKVNELINLCNALEEKLTKKEATAEKLVGAVVNAVASKTNKPKDEKADKKEKMIELVNELIKKHHKGLKKLS